MRKFKVGDLVELKSGGPAMLIKKLTPGNNCVCIWMSRNEEVQDYVFPESCLIYHKEEK